LPAAGYNVEKEKPKMLGYLAVAVGGAFGAMARFAVYNAATSAGYSSFLATLAVNISGALIIGTLYVLLAEKGGLQPYGQHLLTVGFLGAFTTYSSYSLDALRILEQGQTLLAVLYLFGTLLLCLLATWLGLILARALL
jgi:CrcB protein